MKRRTFIIVITCGFAAVIGLWILSWLYTYHCVPQDERSAFGEQFGAINALFSGLAFAGLIFTIFLQQKEIKESQETAVKQSFENTFFNLLREVKNIFNSSIYTGNITGKYIGKQAFSQAYKDYLVNKMKGGGQTDESGNELSNTEFSDIEEAKKIYSQFHEIFSDAGLYLRSLYRLIKFIDESPFDDSDKYQYTSFVRAQLSDDELLVLFYNCTIGYGIEKFKPLVEKWALLKNMPAESLAFVKHRQWISEDAFERKDRYKRNNK